MLSLDGFQYSFSCVRHQIDTTEAAPHSAVDLSCIMDCKLRKMLTMPAPIRDLTSCSIETFPCAKQGWSVQRMPAMPPHPAGEQWGCNSCACASLLAQQAFIACRCCAISTQGNISAHPGCERWRQAGVVQRITELLPHLVSQKILQSVLRIPGCQGNNIPPCRTEEMRVALMVGLGPARRRRG